jgi:predicted Zn-dependent peptidase
VIVAFDAAPERMHTLNLEMFKVLDTLRTRGVSAGEATRAATVQRRLLESRLQDNGYWMNTIGSYVRLGIPLDKVAAPYSESRVSPKELDAAARQYLPGDTYIHLTAMPEDSSSYAKREGEP